MGAETFVLIAIVAFVAAGIVVAAALAFQRRFSVSADEEFEAEGALVDERPGRWPQPEPDVIPQPERAVIPQPERADDLVIRPLTRANHHRLSEEWASVQALYLDNPELAVEQADGLIEDVMRARGYPVSELEDRASDGFMQHGGIVDQYLAAHAIATASRGPGGDRDREAESLRQAFLHYRALFAELLESPAQFRGDQAMTRISRAS